MKQAFWRIPASWIMGIALIGTVCLSGCQKMDAELEEPETRADAQGLIAGSIQENLTIKTTNPDYQLTIYSVRPASCPTGPIIYFWEIMEQDGSWREFPFTSKEYLTTNPPLRDTVYYRRRAICGHEVGYSNTCIVVNTAIVVPTAGTIAEVVELNKGGFNYDLRIPSLQAPTVGAACSWEAYIDGAWSGWDMEHYYNMPERHLTKFRRAVTLNDMTVYSNECTVINYAYYDDPREGTGFDNKIDLGTYSDTFTVGVAVDTRGEYFWDQDRISFCGNDAFMKFRITEPMMVDFQTGSSAIGVRLTVWKETEDWEGYMYSDGIPGSSNGLGESVEGFSPYRDFDDPDVAKISLMMTPGEYSVHIQGAKISNGGVLNWVIGTYIRGMVADSE